MPTFPVRAARLSKEQRRSEITKAAAELFCERGYEQTSMAEIAERLRVAEATLYKHFANKRQLLNRVLEQWYENLREETERDISGMRGDRNRLRFLVWRHLRALADDPAMCRLIFTEVRTEPNYLRSDLYQLNKRYTELLMEVLRQGQRTGAFRRSVTPALVRDFIYGGIEHHVWGYLYGRRTLRADILADQIVDLVCGGIDRRPREPDLSLQIEHLAGLINRFADIMPKSGRADT